MTPPYTTAPWFVVRVAGLPMDVMWRLRAPRTLRLIAEIRELDRALAGMAETLADELHRCIGGNNDTTSRRQLLSLRRDVYLGRAPRRGRPDTALMSSLPPRAAADLERWHAQIEKRGSVQHQAEAELDAEAREGRAALRDIAADPSFLRGLALASPSLYAEAAKWIASGDASLRDRKLERRLAKYVARTATKTSPYSTFTSSTEGRWSATGPALARAVGSSLEPRSSVIELNRATESQIRRAIAALPGVRSTIPLQVNASASERDGVYRWLARREQEAISELASTPTIRRFLAAVQDGADPSRRGVVRTLAGADAARVADVERFLDKLIDSGLIECSLDVSDAALDPWGDLERELQRLGTEPPAPLLGLLHDLQRGLEAYGTAPAADRLERAEEIRRRTLEVQGLLGAGDAPEAPRHAFYEDTLLPGVAVECASGAWAAVLDDLDLLRRLAGAYDRFLPSRLAASAFVRDLHGAGATLPFLQLYSEFCREIREPAGWRSGFRISGADLLRCYEQPYPVPPIHAHERLVELAAIQRRIREPFAAFPIDDGTRRADRQALLALAAELPAYVPPIESIAFYCQLRQGGERPQVVLNELTMGFGRSRARLLRLDAMSGGGAFTRSQRASVSGGRCHAEIAGATDSNLNLRLPMAPLEIAYPGARSSGDAQRRVSLAELAVTHDPRTDALRLHAAHRDGEIVPVHLGLMVEFLLPPAYRFLIQMFGQAVPRFELLKTLATVAPVREHDGVRRYARLALGDVIINRAAWTLPARRVPRPEKGESPLRAWQRLEGWRREHEIPERCFVRAFGSEGHGRPRRVDDYLDKSRKPMFVDFASPLLIEVFDKLELEPDQLLVIEEMLPGPEELVLEADGRGYACELVLEVTSRDREDA
jgi:hypothetical protein